MYFTRTNTNFSLVTNLVTLSLYIFSYKERSLACLLSLGKQRVHNPCLSTGVLQTKMLTKHWCSDERVVIFFTTMLSVSSGGISTLKRKDWTQQRTAQRREKGCFSFTMDISSRISAAVVPFSVSVSQAAVSWSNLKFQQPIARTDSNSTQLKYFRTVDSPSPFSDIATTVLGEIIPTSTPSNFSFSANFDCLRCPSLFTDIPGFFFTILSHLFAN